MEFTLSQLEHTGFRDLFRIDDSDKFVCDFARFVQGFYLQQVSYFDIPITYDGTQMTMPQHLDGRLLNVAAWRYFKTIRSECRYEPNEALLEQIEKTYAFRDSCDRHLKHYAISGWKKWCANARKSAVVNRYLRRADVVLTMHELWAVAIAFFIRKGWGTKEDFAEKMRHAK